MSEVKVDTISERTGAGGVTIDGVLIKDNTVTATGTSVLGTVKITGGSPGADKVLTSDADGDATWAAAASGGKILQVIQSTKKDTDSTTSSGTTFVDIAGTDQDAAGSVWCVKITPAATSSKILCTYTATCGTNGTATVNLRLVRDSTDVFLADAASSRVTTSSIAGIPHNDAMQSSSMTYLDSPSSTSELTYKVQWAAISGLTVYCNRSLSDTDSASYQRSASTITVVEIGA